MKTRPRRLFRRDKSNRAAPSFQRAMTQVVADDLRGSPCVACGQDAGNVFAVWSPTPECVARDFGGDPSKTRRILYRLCGKCADRCRRDKQFINTVEDELLNVWRQGRSHRLRDGVWIA